MEYISLMLTLTAICLSFICPTSPHILGTHPLNYTFHFSAETLGTSRNGVWTYSWNRSATKRAKNNNCTSSSHGFSLRSRMMSKPRTSKQTLSLPVGCPGRHMRYAWSTWGSATIRVFTTSSYRKRKKNKQESHTIEIQQWRSVLK